MLQRRAHVLQTHVVREQPLLALVVVEGEQPVAPDEPFFLQRHHRLGEAVAADEVAKVDADRRVQRVAGARQVGEGGGGLEVAERVGRLARVSPEPEKLSAVREAVDAVLTKHLGIEHRLGRGRRRAGQHAVGVNAPAREAVKALGQVDALDLKRCTAAGRGAQCFAAAAEPIFRKFVAVAGDGEVNVGIHQPRLLERDDAVGIGDIAALVRGAQFDQRHAVLRLIVDDRDLEVVVR